MTIEEVVRQVLVDEHADVLRESVQWLARQLMEVEVSELIGAERGERSRGSGDASQRVSAAAVGHAGRARSSCRSRRSVRAATSRAFWQPRKRSEQALVSVVQQAYVCGVSTRRVDQLVESLGLRISQVGGQPDLRGRSMSRSRRSATRPLEGRYPYLFVDAKVEKVRDGGRVVSASAS